MAGGADLNRDGVNDLVIGASHNAEGGADAGAVYVVWGGGNANIDLSAVAQNLGGAKVVGNAGSLLGTTVALSPDLNADGSADLIIGAPGSGESVYTLYAPPSWQPDTNVFGTNGDDVIGAGFRSGLHAVGDSADTILALDGNDTVDAGLGNDDIDGGAGGDVLLGGGGNDRLDGGTGADQLVGGMGDDVYLVDDAGDSTVEAAGEGSDTVLASVNWTLAAHLERLELQGAALAGTGNADANTLVGNAGANTLDGGGGADRMEGGLGNDTYLVDDIGDQTIELSGQGTDTVVAAIDWTLAGEIETLQLTGAARSGIGNALNNSLTGTTSADSLDGGAGNDTMTGGAGDDVFIVDAVGDVVQEAAGGGTDTVRSSVNIAALAAQVENLVLTGAARSGTGNALDNQITGTTGDDTLDGGTGNDTLIGGAGNDSYRVDAAGDVIVESAGAGTDTVLASFDYTLGNDLENLTLTGSAHVGTGNALDNLLVGGAGNDALDGAAGADTMAGGGGDDTYLIDSVSDVVQEGTGGGHDTMVATVDVGIAAGVEVLQVLGEGLTATGDAADNALLGSAGHQTLVGNAGNDVLDGGAGADTMVGGDGADTYYVDDLGDVVVETATGGIDTVVTSTGGVVGDNIENVRLAAGAHVLTGNAGNNTLAGNGGDDTLDGGDGDDLLLAGDGDDILVARAGTDTLSGGSGNDFYRVHGATAHIEDFLGHDTLDASEATGDSSIDLSGETVSRIEDHDCDLGHGGTTASPLDVQFLQDLSGSFGDDIANVRTLVPQIVSALARGAGQQPVWCVFVRRQAHRPVW